MEASVYSISWLAWNKMKLGKTGLFKKIEIKMGIVKWRIMK